MQRKHIICALLLALILLLLSTALSHAQAGSHFESKVGGYVLPFKTRTVSNYYKDYKNIFESLKADNQIRKNSAEGYWSYIDTPPPGRSRTTEKGVEQFVRYFDDDHTFIHISWFPPKYHDAETHFNKGLAANKENGGLIKFSVKKFRIDGHQAVSGIFLRTAGICTTTVVYARGKCYLISYVNAVAFTDQENTPEKLKQIKFLK